MRTSSSLLTHDVLSRSVTVGRHPHVDQADDYPVGLVPSHNPAHAHYGIGTRTRESVDECRAESAASLTWAHGWVGS